MDLFQADLARYHAQLPPGSSRLRRVQLALRAEGVCAIWWFRLGQYLHNEARLPVRLLLEIPYRIAEKWISYTAGIHLHPRTVVGPGFYIGHYGNIWISPLVRMGANCSVHQGVTIGVAGLRDTSLGGPQLGDRVWVGPNAVITGQVKIGDGAVIGANSLVATDLPENAVAIGVPARVIGYSGSAKLIRLAQPQPVSSSVTGDV
ncbi:MAG: DapH/DapD/GlmU-related protein [bacterium]